MVPAAVTYLIHGQSFYLTEAELHTPPSKKKNTSSESLVGEEEGGVMVLGRGGRDVKAA